MQKRYFESQNLIKSIFENIFIDALVQIMQDHAALMIGGAISVVDVTTAIRFGPVELGRPKGNRTIDDA